MCHWPMTKSLKYNDALVDVKDSFRLSSELMVIIVQSVLSI